MIRDIVYGQLWSGSAYFSLATSDFAEYAYGLDSAVQQLKPFKLENFQ
jgi:hypothetical protein